MFEQRMLDALNRALLIVGLICSILGSLLFQNIPWLRAALSVIAAGCLIFAVIRLLGGNQERRYRENQWFLTALTAVKTWLRSVGGWISGLFGGKKADGAPRQHTKRAHKARKNPTWSEIRQYKYFICPQCTQRLRVPRGKGKLRVTCTRCGNVFETKS